MDGAGCCELAGRGLNLPSFRQALDAGGGAAEGSPGLDTNGSSLPHLMTAVNISWTCHSYPPPPHATLPPASPPPHHSLPHSHLNGAGSEAGISLGIPDALHPHPRLPGYTRYLLLPPGILGGWQRMGLWRVRYRSHLRTHTFCAPGLPFPSITRLHISGAALYAACTRVHWCGRPPRTVAPLPRCGLARALKLSFVRMHGGVETLVGAQQAGVKESWRQLRRVSATGDQ